jgi:hypothetical protein
VLSMMAVFMAGSISVNAESLEGPHAGWFLRNHRIKRHALMLVTLLIV